MNAPPLERVDTEKFRQWLAGMVTQDAPPSSTERDDMKVALIAFLAACPHVYGLNDRMILWEKIGNAAAAGLETCNGDINIWVNDVLAAIKADGGRVAACEPLIRAIETINNQDDRWQSACLTVMRELRFTIPVFAREQWNLSKETKANG